MTYVIKLEKYVFLDYLKICIVYSDLGIYNNFLKIIYTLFNFRQFNGHSSMPGGHQFWIFLPRNLKTKVHTSDTND